MSGAVPPPQPPSDPNQPPGYQGAAGPNDPASYPVHPSGTGGTGPTGIPAPAGSDPYEPTPGEVGAYPVTPPGSSSPGASSPSSSPSSVSGDSAKAAMKSANPLDLGIIGAGVLAFLLSLFTGYYTYKVTVDGDDSLFGELPGASDAGSMNAWHGFFGWFSALLALAAAVVMVLGLLGVIANKSAVRLGVLAAFGIAALCALLALLVVPGSDADQSIGGVTIDINPGHGITYWLSLLVILGGTALAFLRKDATD